ncbi:MAG: hypothetical protein Kow00106_18150 [Anaerolineae bacterium]
MIEDILIYVAVGFAAQMIDGALGMAYGVSSTTFLLSTGVGPALASASVHMAEVFTTLVSGLAHLRFGNVDRTLFRKLVVPGVLGGVLGAYVLSELPGDTIKPYVAIYLMLMGLRILWKAWRQQEKSAQGVRHILPLGLAGGFFDAIGGGGWGPIVTSTLVANGHNPRTSVGSVNAAEFFVTFSQSVVFLVTIKLANWEIIAGLIAGGVIAAPLAALVCRRLSARKLMFFVGVLIVALSLRTLVLTF